jgi:KUP system potassium uptake protein
MSFYVLATLATVIASQAVISGVFSLTRQAVQLGYCPRMDIVHTSEQEAGQIYIPTANWGLLVAVIGLVLGFRTSSNLAAAYGIAVAITMVITTLLALVVARKLWGWSWLRCSLMIIVFLLVDIAFFSANALKILHGGWFPLLIGAVLYTLMITWKQGRKLLARRLHQESIPLSTFIERLASGSALRVPGTAVFLTSDPEGVPNTLLHNLRHNKVVHERIVLLTVVTEEIPRVPDKERIEIQDLGHNFHRVIAHYGFAEDPKIPHILELCAREELEFNLLDTTFFLGRETLIPTPRPGMAMWREVLFVTMSRNAARAMDFFRIPHNRVVEMGTQVEL